MKQAVLNVVIDEIFDFIGEKIIEVRADMDARMPIDAGLGEQKAMISLDLIEEGIGYFVNGTTTFGKGLNAPNPMVDLEWLGGTPKEITQ